MPSSVLLTYTSVCISTNRHTDTRERMKLLTYVETALLASCQPLLGKVRKTLRSVNVRHLFQRELLLCCFEKRGNET